ncbi:MAG: hypothetical protein KatS3mg129_1794 [Leptospiraceae bacterium]|nr:MAG: hypothetical protein KatS3mg129_1794 [Leptospiraceae bacterium]
MRKRIFYIIHLDRERIILLSTIFTTLLMTSFSIGYKIGKEKILQNTNQIQVPSPELQNKEKINELYPDQAKVEEEPKQTEKKSTISIEELKKAEKISLNQNILEKKTSSLEEEIVDEDIEKKEDWKIYKKPFTSDKKTNSNQKSEKYMIQIAAFKTKDDVLNFKNQLEKNGITCSYKKRKKYYILYTTSNSYQEAINIKEELKKHHIKDAIIKKLNN